MWSPKKVPSDIISLNQKDIDETTKILKLCKTNNEQLLKLCIDNAALVVKFNRLILVYKGQGDGDTKWKGWSWKLLLIKLLIWYYLYNKQLI